jgi:outer membrane biogenesis lipoprotein LolB
MNPLKIVLLIFLSTLILSCGTARKASTAIDAGMSAKELINLHQKSEARFTTLASRVQVNYDDGKTSQSLSVSLRMQKDETIWVSASILGISIARLLITPEKVSYYETIGKTYFDGDFSLLSSWLGVDIDFEMAQNILLGNAVFELNDKNYTASISDANYRLTPKNQQELFQHIFLLNPSNFRMASQQVIQPNDQRVLTIDYVSYQQAGNHIYPKEIRLNAIEQSDQTRIILDFRNIDVNPVVSFPFRIPGGYEEITLD